MDQTLRSNDIDDDKIYCRSAPIVSPVFLIPALIVGLTNNQSKPPPPTTTTAIQNSPDIPIHAIWCNERTKSAYMYMTCMHLLHSIAKYSQLSIYALHNLVMCHIRHIRVCRSENFAILPIFPHTIRISYSINPLNVTSCQCHWHTVEMLKWTHFEELKLLRNLHCLRLFVTRSVVKRDRERNMRAVEGER